MILIIIGAVIELAYGLLVLINGTNNAETYQEVCACGTICILAGLIILGVINIENQDQRWQAVEYSEALQALVDTAEQHPEHALTKEERKEIREWNGRITMYRQNQEHPLWKTHYILSEDWNDVPLVRYER